MNGLGVAVLDYWISGKINLYGYRHLNNSLQLTTVKAGLG